MNPYDFVPLDLSHPPERCKPVWHAMLTRQNGQKLYSGYISVYIGAETPLFIRDTNIPEQNENPAKLKTHIRSGNGDDDYIIPGSSLKGMLRTVVETLCRGCMTIFRLPDHYSFDSYPKDFHPCTNNADLCMACRLFGMMGQKASKWDKIDIFLGKDNIGDARVDKESLALYEPIYTAVLDMPKPRHRAFYLDQEQRLIAGRKFYFHHDSKPRTADELIAIHDKAGKYPDQRSHSFENDKRERYRNQYIQPLKRGTEFHAYIDFTQLEADEFAALWWAITLLPEMRHKIGYGKPLGLGSIWLVPEELSLIDYATRYSNFRAGRGMTYYDLEEITDLSNEHLASLDPQISSAISRFRSYPSFERLQHIWKWPADSSVEYCYPSQGWFKDHSTARIADTKDLWPGD